MRERSLKRRTAFILAVLLTFMNCFSSFASETTEVTENPEINEIVNSTENEEDNVNIKSSGETETSGTVSGSSNKNSEEENAEENSGDLSENPNHIDTDEKTTTAEVSDNELGEDTSNGEEPKETIETSNVLRTLGSSRIGSLRLLGASGTEDTGDGIWYGNAEDTIKWRVSENVLYISRNDAYTGSSFAGKMKDYSPDGRTPWYDKYGSIIKDITVLDGVTKIGAYAFFELENVRSLSIPDSVSEIETGALSGLKKMAQFGLDNNPNFYVDDSTHGSGTGAIYKLVNGKYTLLFYPIAGVEKPFVIQDKIGAIEVTRIDDYACYNCYKYPGILSIPSTVSSVGASAFYGCGAITQIDVKGRNFKDKNKTECNLETIGDKAFGKCASLKEVILPCSVKDAPRDMLEDVTGLEYIVYYGKDSNDTITVLENKYKSDSKLDDVQKKANDGRMAEDFVTPIMVPYDRCIIKFDLNGAPKSSNTHIKPLTVEYNKPIGQEPLEPVWEGSVFNGWFNNSTKYTSTTPDIINDVTVTASWKVAYKITFRTEGGKFSDDEIEKEKNAYPSTKFTDWPDDNPTKEHATFIGWYYEDEKITFVINNDVPKKYANKKVLMSDGYTFNKNAVLTAKYIDMIPTTFRAPNGSLIDKIYVSPNECIPKSTLESLSRNTLLDSFNNNPDYIWKGWSTDNGIWFNLEDPEKITQEETYTAIYDLTVEFTYHGYYADKDDVLVKTCRAGDSHKILTPQSRPITKYEFLGWFNEKDEKYYSSVIKTSPSKLKYDLYAKWAPVYTVSTNNQESVIYGTPVEDNTVKTYYISSGKSLYSTGSIPHDISGNWAFQGWYTEDGTEITSDTPINQNYYLYAKWIKGHSITYYVDEAGGLYQMPIIVQNGSKLPVPDPPTIQWADEHGHMGYDLKGWFTEPNGQGEEARNTTIVTKDMTFYGYWVENPNRDKWPMYIVSFNSMGGPEVPYQRVSVNSLLSVPAEPTWTDHKFLGWYKDAGFSEPWNFFEDRVTEDRYLYAKWITWTEEDEDNSNGIYWVRMLKGGKAPLTEYFKESGLQFSYDKNVVKILQKGRTVKGKRVGETLITATKGDGSEYPVKVRAFVFKQELQDMYAFNTSTTFNAPDFLTVSGFLPDRWESTKPSVATIDSKTGFIQVKGRGRTKIKAYYNNKAVTATLYSEVPKFAKKFYRFKTGQSKKIKIKRVKKYDIVSWNIITESGNSSGKSVVSGGSAGFAEVDNNGLVTAVSAGEVTLAATVYGQTITTKLHIEPPTLKKNQLEIDVNKVKKLKLSRTKLKYVEWKSSNDSVAYVDPTSGKVYALKAGRVTLRTTAGGVTNTCNVIVTDPGATGTSLGKTANSTLKS